MESSSARNRKLWRQELHVGDGAAQGEVAEEEEEEEDCQVKKMMDAIAIALLWVPVGSAIARFFELKFTNHHIWCRGLFESAIARASLTSRCGYLSGSNDQAMSCSSSFLHSLLPCPKNFAHSYVSV